MIEYYPKHVTKALTELIEIGGTQGPKDYENVKWGLEIHTI